MVESTSSEPQKLNEWPIRQIITFADYSATPQQVERSLRSTATKKSRRESHDCRLLSEPQKLLKLLTQT